MIDTIGKRLKHIRKELRLSQQEFADKIGITKSAISAVENEKSKLSQDVLCRMILDFNININYLLVGKGLMFLEENPSDSTIIPPELEKIIKEYLKNSK